MQERLRCASAPFLHVELKRYANMDISPSDVAYRLLMAITDATKKDEFYWCERSRRWERHDVAVLHARATEILRGLLDGNEECLVDDAIRHYENYKTTICNSAPFVFPRQRTNSATDVAVG